MTQTDDPITAPNGAGESARVRQSTRGWRSYGAAAAFWLLAVSGPLLLSVAWVWYGFAFNEEMTEQGKAVLAGTTMAGTGLALGGVPLVIAHLLVLVPLLMIGAKYHARPARSIVLALVSVAAASAVGIAVAQLLWSGMLFTMYADAPGHFIP